MSQRSGEHADLRGNKRWGLSSKPGKEGEQVFISRGQRLREQGLPQRQREGSKDDRTAAGGEWRRDVWAHYQEWVLPFKAACRCLQRSVLGAQRRQTKVRRGYPSGEGNSHQWAQGACRACICLKRLFTILVSKRCCSFDLNNLALCGNPGRFVVVPQRPPQEKMCGLIWCLMRAIALSAP